MLLVGRILNVVVDAQHFLPSHEFIIFPLPSFSVLLSHCLTIEYLAISFTTSRRRLAQHTQNGQYVFYPPSIIDLCHDVTCIRDFYIILTLKPKRTCMLVCATQPTTVYLGFIDTNKFISPTDYQFNLFLSSQ